MLLLGLATSTIVGRSSEILTMYQATPALTMPTNSSASSRKARSTVPRMERLFFPFTFFLRGRAVSRGVLP